MTTAHITGSGRGPRSGEARPGHEGEDRPRRVVGSGDNGRKGTNGVGTSGVTANFMFFWQRDLLGTPVNLLLSSQKWQGVPFFPNLSKFISVDPICPQSTNWQGRRSLAGLEKGGGAEGQRAEGRLQVTQRSLKGDLKVTFNVISLLDPLFLTGHGRAGSCSAGPPMWQYKARQVELPDPRSARVCW